MYSSHFDNHTYFYIQPNHHQESAEAVHPSSIAKCKYCKSENALANHQIQKNQYLCCVCGSYNELPKNYKLNDSYLPIWKATLEEANERINFMIVLDGNTSKEILDALQSISKIMSSFNYIDICFIVYDKNIKILQLIEDGRVIQVTKDVQQITIEHFYPCSKETLSVLEEYLAYDWSTNCTTINGSNLIKDIIPVLKKRTVLLWIGRIDEQLHYQEHHQYDHIQTFCIVSIPTVVIELEFSSNLRALTLNNNRVLYIGKNSKNKLQKTHYKLYEWFENKTVFLWEVGSRSENNYPPSIISDSRQLVCNLNCPVLLKTLKKTNDLRYQVCIRYIKNNAKCILVINFTHQSISSMKGSLQIQRYIRLYLIVKKIPTRKQIYDFPALNGIDIDIYCFLKESSLLLSLQLSQALNNPFCIYAIWPLVHKTTQSDTVIFYFFGHYIEKAESQELQNKVKQVEEECQIYYSCRETLLPLFYQNIAEELSSQEMEANSESQEEEMDYRYYRIDLKKGYNIQL